MAWWKKVLVSATLAAFVSPALAEQAEIKVAQQYGVSFLPPMVMERDRLVYDFLSSRRIPAAYVMAGGLVHRNVSANSQRSATSPSVTEAHTA